MSTEREDSLQRSEVRENTGGEVDPLEPETEPSSRSEDLDGGAQDIKNDALRLLQELEEENHRVSQRNMELQAQLVAFHLWAAAPDEQDPDPDVKEYQDCLERLVELRRQRASQMETAQQREEEMSLRNQEELNQVENEWRSLLTRKRKLVVSLLGGHLCPEAARAKVDAALGSEQLRRQELRKLRLIHAEMESRRLRLEAQLAEETEETPDLLERQFKQLLVQRMQQTKVDERRSQEASKLRKNMKRTLELLSNMKEKLHWSLTEVRAKRERLAQLEAALSPRKDLLARSKRACGGLRRANAELKQTRGLLGNTLLLWDFGVTVGAAQRLHDKLEKLKRRREEIASS